MATSSTSSTSYTSGTPTDTPTRQYKHLLDRLDNFQKLIATHTHTNTTTTTTNNNNNKTEHAETQDKHNNLGFEDVDETKPYIEMDLACGLFQTQNTTHTHLQEQMPPPDDAHIELRMPGQARTRAKPLVTELNSADEHPTEAASGSDGAAAFAPADDRASASAARRRVRVKR